MTKTKEIEMKTDSNMLADDDPFALFADARLTAEQTEQDAADELGLSNFNPGPAVLKQTAAQTEPANQHISGDDRNTARTLLKAMKPIPALELIRHLAIEAGTAVIWPSIPVRAAEGVTPKGVDVRAAIDGVRAGLKAMGSDAAGAWLSDLGRDSGIEVSRSRFGSERGPVTSGMSPLRRVEAI
jgi:hypothetical protein